MSGNNTSTWPLVWRFATASGVPRRSLVVAVVVGTVINLINQGDFLVGDGEVNWFKVALTYCVPYLVATYGAVSFQFQTLRTSVGGDEP